MVSTFLFRSSVLLYLLNMFLTGVMLFLLKDADFNSKNLLEYGPFLTSLLLGFSILGQKKQFVTQQKIIQVLGTLCALDITHTLLEVWSSHYRSYQPLSFWVIDTLIIVASLFLVAGVTLKRDKVLGWLNTILTFLLPAYLFLLFSQQLLLPLTVM